MAIPGQWKISLKDVPDHIAIHDYIYQTTDLKKQSAHFHKRHTFSRLKLHYAVDELKAAFSKKKEQVSFYSFRYQGQAITSDAPYLSASLTFNPEAHDKWTEDPHGSTLGSNLLSKNSASFYQDNDELLPLKNSYHDTFSFVSRSPLSETEGFKEFLDSFKRTLVRSRISQIVAKKEESQSLKFNWHNDESIFLNLRINVPLMTSDSYAHQLMIAHDEGEAEIVECIMEEGSAYVYDTELWHRAYCKKLNEISRVNMICGVSPWFDYDNEEQCWISNEYYGEIHPFDMLEKGLITPYIKDCVS